MSSKLFFKQLYKITKLIIVILPIVGLVVLIYLDLAPAGHLEFIYDFSKDSPVVTNLFPANRMTEVNQIKNSESYWQAIKQDPVYFEVRLPQKFDLAKVEVFYQNQNQPLAQIGLRTIGESEWNYEFRPVENQLLDKLSWPVVENQAASLWQRKKNFLSLEQFFDKIDSLEKVGAYYYNLERKFILPEYQPVAEYQELNKALRGNYSFYTYIKNEPLDLNFKVQDINRSEGPDRFAVKVYDEIGKKIYEQGYEDDGYISKYDPVSAPRDIKIKIDGLPEGFYKIQFEAEDEIFTRQIKTRQQYLTFIDRLYLVDNAEYADGFIDLNYQPTVLYSTIARLGFETTHPLGLQTIKISDQLIDINLTHKNYFVTSKIVPNYIFIPENDLKIFGRGLLAFSQSQFFNPEIYNLRDFAGDLGVDYLISSYHSPKEINGWKSNSVEFDLSQAYIDNRKLRFAISIPELNDQSEIIPLKQIKVTLNKDPLTWSELIDKVWSYFKNKF